MIWYGNIPSFTRDSSSLITFSFVNFTILIQVARRASYYAQKKPDAWIEQELTDHPEEEGLVVGDEMRLRQIVNNLASNACKFTLSGGEIRIVTRLMFPAPSLKGDEEGDNEKGGEGVKETIEAAGADVGGEKKGEPSAGEKGKEEGMEDKFESAPESTPLSSPLKERDFALTKWASRKRRRSRANTNVSGRPLERNASVVSTTATTAKGKRGSRPPTATASAAAATSGTGEGQTDVAPLSAAQLSRHNSVEEMRNLENIVVRVEVHDTGFGIRAKDLVDNKLFSPYVQTEVSLCLLFLVFSLVFLFISSPVAFFCN